VHCESAAQVTEQSSVQTTVQWAPCWQVALPPSPRVIWQAEPWQVTVLLLPATSVQLAPAAQVASQEPPQLPMHVWSAGQESAQPVVAVQV
jgi:hypothetical protein